MWGRRDAGAGVSRSLEWIGGHDAGEAIARDRITAILTGDRGVTAQTAILLGERFGTTPGFWLNLQMLHDLQEARRHMRQTTA